MATTTIPTLPVERFAPARIVLEQTTHHNLSADRLSASNATDSTPDTIGIWANHYCGGISHNVSMLLSPAMLVHMANVLLSDSERAAIHHAPALAGATTE